MGVLGKIFGLLRRLLGLGGDLDFGWKLVTYLVVGAGATLVTATLDYLIGFGHYLAGLPLLARWAVYASVGVVAFSLIVNVWRLLPALWARLWGEGDEELRRRCRELSVEIYQFMADRDRDDPADELWHAQRRAATEEERDRLFERQSNQSSRHFHDTMHRYRERYETEALTLFDRAQERGWVQAGKRSWFETPTNTHGIYTVAQILGTIGRRP